MVKAKITIHVSDHFNKNKNKTTTIIKDKLRIHKRVIKKTYSNKKAKRKLSENK